MYTYHMYHMYFSYFCDSSPYITAKDRYRKDQEYCDGLCLYILSKAA